MGMPRRGLVIALAFVAGSLWRVAARADEPAIAIVAAMRGTATVQPGGSGSAVPLTIHAAVYQGDVVQTGADSRVKLALRDGSSLSLGSNTGLTLDHLSVGPAGSSASTFTQLSGYVRAVVAPLGPSGRFDIETPSMVAAVRGTDWIQNYDAGTTQIFVVKGRVLTAGVGAYADDRVLLHPGQGVTFSADAPHTDVVRWRQPKIDAFVAATTVP